MSACVVLLKFIQFQPNYLGCRLRVCNFTGKCGIRYGSPWWLQVEVYGAQGKKDTQVHHLQDWGETETSHCGEAWRACPRLRRICCLPSCWWVPLCGLWLWVYDWRQCSQKQDFFHCMVMFCLGLPVTVVALILNFYLNMIVSFEGLLTHQGLEARWFMQAPKIDSRESLMVFRLSCKQLILLRLVLMCSKPVLAKRSPTVAAFSAGVSPLMLCYFYENF